MSNWSAFVVETAVNIGYSCRLLSDDMADIHVIDADTYDLVEDQLKQAKSSMAAAANQKPETEVNGGYAIIINGHSLVKRR